MTPPEWLIKCIVPGVSAEFTAVERDAKIKGLPEHAGGLLREWDALLANMQDHDELWEFESPIEYWDSLCGASGIALVRDGAIVAEVIIDMN